MDTEHSYHNLVAILDEMRGHVASLEVAADRTSIDALRALVDEGSDALKELGAKYGEKE